MAAIGSLPPGVRADVPLVFTAHSVPDAMAAASGPPPGGRYPSQLAEASGLIAERVTAATGGGHPWRLVYQSRSGPPAQPWLGPDVCDYLEDLARDGAPGAVLIPVGFVSDHMEVVHDLDIEAAQTARRLGLPLARAATPSTDPRFISMITALVTERLEGQVSPGSAGLPGLWHRRLLPGWPPRPAVQAAGRPLMSAAAAPDPQALLTLARSAAGAAAAMLAARRPAGPLGRPDVADTKSSPTDVVTEMDRAAEAMIADRILAERPGDAILGEEGGESGHGRVRWIVDPLDGTVNYLYGLADWAVSIAAEVDGVVVAGVVAIPRHREVFTRRRRPGQLAAPGGGARGPAAVQRRGAAGQGPGLHRFRVRAGPAGGAGRDRGRRAAPGP